MKKKYKIIFWICGIFLAIFLVANILIAAFAPRIIEQQIQQNLKLKASLGKISLSLPFTITLEKLEIGDLASIKKISLTPNLVALLFGKIVIHGLNIVEPVINLEQSVDGKLNLPVLDQKGKPPAIYLTSLNLRDGKIIFTDKKVALKGFGVIVNKLNIKVAKVVLPVTSLATNFSVSAQLLSSGGKSFGDITFSGWLDYLAKDLDAELEVKDLDVTKFSVYCGNFISNRKLSSARLDLSSNFKAKNNALKIITKFNLSNLVYADAQEQPLNLDLMKNALDIFTDPKGNLRLEFNINTLLDNPALSQEKIKSIILKAAMKNLSNQSPQQLIDKVTTIIDQYKGLGKELKAIFGQ
ncbi:MAG: DUF748 domain-containing protein [Candidatus Omnitrophota bacterium]|nr:DUF748 domain-containing protein [Candidatus Omnitrophota bacterium]